MIGDISVSGFYDITPAIGGGYYLIDERSYLTKLDEDGEVIFTHHVKDANLSVIELDNGDIIIGGSGAFLDGGYGGGANITRLSFSNSAPTAQ